MRRSGTLGRVSESAHRLGWAGAVAAGYAAAPRRFVGGVGATWRGMGLAVLASLVALALAGSARAQAPVSLGTADSFAVLAGSTVTNTGPTVVNGDLGVSPGTKAQSASRGMRPLELRDDDVDAERAVGQPANARDPPPDLPGRQAARAEHAAAAGIRDRKDQLRAGRDPETDGEDRILDPQLATKSRTERDVYTVIVSHAEAVSPRSASCYVRRSAVRSTGDSLSLRAREGSRARPPRSVAVSSDE